MHRFTKGPIPEPLVGFRHDKIEGEGRTLADVIWKELPTDVKQALQERLAADQSYLCAYCGGRIRPDRMRIEHWDAQHARPDRRFDCDNLLGVCGGSDGVEVHCDQYRGTLAPAEQALVLKPDRDPVDTLFSFAARPGSSGLWAEIPQRPDAVSDIARLNLNAERLRRNRSAALRALKDKVGKAFADRRVTLAYVEGLKRPNPLRLDDDRTVEALPAYYPAVRRYIDTLARKVGGS